MATFTYPPDSPLGTAKRLTYAMMTTLRNYLRLTRLDKPVGIWLVFFPTAWAVCLAKPGRPDITLLFLLFAGATLARAAGCIINDLTDRKLDAGVERTKNRPLASGAIPVNHAFVLLAALGLAALGVALELQRTVIWLALLATPLIISYPWMKRITWWPQAFLGITFNLGVWMGWAATGTPFSLATVLLYLGCVCWTLGYDTIYALQDMDDDMLMGIRSTARRLKTRILPFVGSCYALFLLCLMFAGLMAGGSLFFILGVVAAALQLRWQMGQVPHAKALHMAGDIFRSNQWLGLGLFVALYLDRAIGL